MRWGFLVLLLILPTAASAQAPDPDAHPRRACTDGRDCYCDCVLDTAGTGANVGNFASAACQTANVPIDLNALQCEDFENPTFEEDHSADNDWKSIWGGGTTPCVVGTANRDFEGPGNACKNIIQKNDPACPLFSAGDDDRNETGEIRGFSGAWDGCQTLGFKVEPGKKGGQIGGQDWIGGRKVNTLSMTAAYKYAPGHQIGSSTPQCDNTKADRYYRVNSPQDNVPVAGFHRAGGSDCCRGSGGAVTPGNITTDNYPFPSLLKSTFGESGINGGGQCCGDNCFGDAATMIGVECHVGGGKKNHRHIHPAEGLWKPGQPGGVPMAIEGDKDGVDEWMCFQWTLENMQTNQADFRFWINGTPVIRLENFKGANDDGPLAGVELLNTWSTAGNCFAGPKVLNLEVRDNYHVTASATPIPCAQIGFDGLPATQPAPDPEPEPDPEPDPDPIGKPGRPVLITP